MLGKPPGKYHKIETKKILNIYITAYQELHEAWGEHEVTWWWPDMPKYWVFFSFQFCDIHLEAPLISMNMYHLGLMPESYNEYELGYIQRILMIFKLYVYFWSVFKNKTLFFPSVIEQSLRIAGSMH